MRVLEQTRPRRKAAGRTAAVAQRHTAALLLLLATALTGASASFTAPPAALPPAEDLIAAARGAGPLGAIAQRPHTLSSAQLARAVALRALLPSAEMSRLDRTLAGAAPAAQRYLAQAFAAGHPVAELVAFGAVVAGRDAGWLARRLAPLDPASPGPVRFLSTRMRQFDGTTCGSAAIVAAKAVLDPLYAWALTTGGRPDSPEESDESFARRLRAEQQRVHDRTDTLWPQSLGTPPWGVSALLSRDPAGLGARYRWVSAVPLVPALAGTVLRRALAAAALGYPVPVLLGDLIPRHYVLLLGQDGDAASFYEPSAGAVIVVSTRDLLRPDVRKLGFPRLHGAVLPG
ncbi:hypothetical protein AB0J80_21030 [Actinoplanes sp. NPDC049548]|uniref:hypothetical protein n=1 Tax=Actinoplanes sp. NPDC049548 TaxID=3155152 RepID=UPI00343A2C56